MRKFFYLAMLAIIGLAMTSCEQGQKDFYLTDLQGLWLEDGTQHYVRFTTDTCAEKEGHFWGYEWDLKDETESDVIDDPERFHANGWFSYKLNQAELLEIHKVGKGWADVPKVYTLTLLTDKKMTYHPKDYKNEKVSFTKQ